MNTFRCFFNILTWSIGIIDAFCQIFLSDCLYSFRIINWQTFLLTNVRIMSNYKLQYGIFKLASILNIMAYYKGKITIFVCLSVCKKQARSTNKSTYAKLWVDAFLSLNDKVIDNGLKSKYNQQERMTNLSNRQNCLSSFQKYYFPWMLYSTNWGILCQSFNWSIKTWRYKKLNTIGKSKITTTLNSKEN